MHWSSLIKLSSSCYMMLLIIAERLPGSGISMHPWAKASMSWAGRSCDFISALIVDLVSTSTIPCRVWGPPWELWGCPLLFRNESLDNPFVFSLWCEGENPSVRVQWGFTTWQWWCNIFLRNVVFQWFLTAKAVHPSNLPTMSDNTMEYKPNL